MANKQILIGDVINNLVVHSLWHQGDHVVDPE
jgi:hypothetical protein